MDGGSSDNSVEIIKKYEPWLKYWVSEKDNGQADAIYRGFEKATGEIMAWLNSDDYYLPGAFSEVIHQFIANDKTEMLLGGCLYIRANGKKILKNYGLLQDYTNLLQVGMFTSQPSTFWKREAYMSVGGIDTCLQFCMDYDLFIKLQQRTIPIKSSKILSAYRYHDETKSTKMKDILSKEDYLIGQRYGRYETSMQDLDLINSSSWKKYRRNQRLHFLFDLYHDPLYFLKYSINYWLNKSGLRS
jgi:glycosyltransferase involved in cell wall biosynthesis